MMDFPVTAEFVATANCAKLHEEARGESTSWPASFVQLDDGDWVYRVDDVETFVADVDGVPTEQTRPWPGVDVDEATVEAAIAGHVPGHCPLDEFGRLLTLLALYEGQQIPPASELAAMGGYTVEDLQDEFYAWLDAGEAGL